MNTLTQNINEAFNQTMSLLCKKYHRQQNKSALYVRFGDKCASLYLFSEGKEPKPLFFKQILSRKMIGLGITTKKVYKALSWLKLKCQEKMKKPELALLLFTTDKTKQAFVSVCHDGKHLISYRMSDVLERFDLKQERMN